MLNGYEWLKKLQRLSFIEKILSYLDSANPNSENSTDLTDISYPQWQNRFLIDRLNLALWLAFLFFLSKSILSFIFFMLGKYPSLEEWEIARIVVHLTLLGCIFILRSFWGDRHLGLIFLCFSWSVTMIEQILDTVTGNVNPEFYLDVDFLFSGNFNSSQMVFTPNIPGYYIRLLLWCQSDSRF